MSDRDARGRFLRGHSIRPNNNKAGGRPTNQELRAIRELVLEAIGGEEGVLKMVKAMEQAVNEGNVRAFDSLLDRVYGKVAQPIEIGTLPDEVRAIDED